MTPSTVGSTGRVPVDEGLFVEQDGDVRLLGSRCPRCHAYAFPAKETCANPDCDTALTEAAQLGPRGTVFSYTIQYYDLPAPYDLAPAPYAIGLVELEQPIRVAGLLTIADPESVRVGQQVRLSVRPVGLDPDGKEVVTWAFDVLDEEPARA